MAKRFSDSGKWRKSFLMGLPPQYKLLWLYLIDECDNAGIWDCNFALAKFTLGMDVDPDEALRLFDGRVVAIDNGKKWFVKSFIHFQYGEINPQSKVHYSVIKRLELFGLMDSVQFVDGENIIQNFKGDSRGIYPPIVKVKVDVKEEGGLGETASPYPERSLVQEQIRAANAASPQAVADMRNQFLADSNQQLLLHKLLAARGGHNERLSREDLAKFTLGIDVDPDEALRLFDGRVVAIDNGEKWWIKSFIEYKYGKLNPKNFAHSSAIKRLELFGLMDSVQFVDGENVSQNLKGLARGLQAPKDKEKDKDKEGGVGETRSPYPERSLVQEQIRAANAASPQAVADMRNQFLADSNQQLLLHKLLAARGGHNERLSREDLDTWLDVFITTLETDGKPLPSNYGDFSNHFRNWMKFNYRTTVNRFQAKEEPLEPHVARYLARKNNGQA